MQENAVELKDLQPGRSLPMTVDGYVQCVVIQGVLYLGGGWSSTGDRSDEILKFHDNHWIKLPHCLRYSFAMATLHDQLVLVGGEVHKKSLPRELKVWDGQKDKWTEGIYPKMAHGRFDCSAVSHGGVLAVAGGWKRASELLDTISLLDTNTADCNWKTASVRLPVCCNSMKSVMVGDCWYLMGGSSHEGQGGGNNIDETDIVFSVSFSELQKEGSSVKTIKGLNCVSSTPVAYGGHLYAIGGKKSSIASCQIMKLHFVLPGARDGSANSASQQDSRAVWTKVGKLPQAAWNYVCAVTDTGLIVTGGELDDDNCSTKTYLAPFV